MKNYILLIVLNFLNLPIYSQVLYTDTLDSNNYSKIEYELKVADSLYHLIIKKDLESFKSSRNIDCFKSVDRMMEDLIWFTSKEENLKNNYSIFVKQLKIKWADDELAKTRSNEITYLIDETGDELIFIFEKWNKNHCVEVVRSYRDKESIIPLK